MYTSWIVRGVGIAAVAVFAAHAQLPEVREVALAELGIEYGAPGMSGFVFVEGRYLAPPSTSHRWQYTQPTGGAVVTSAL